jgi:hypothetical protein
VGEPRRKYTLLADDVDVSAMIPNCDSYMLSDVTVPETVGRRVALFHEIPALTVHQRLLSWVTK